MPLQGPYTHLDSLNSLGAEQRRQLGSLSVFSVEQLCGLIQADREGVQAALGISASQLEAVKQEALSLLPTSARAAYRKQVTGGNGFGAMPPLSESPD
jgi:hypothetical protein